MPREPFASLDELLAPETLSELVGSAIGSVRCLPLAGGHSASGSHLLAIEANGGEGTLGPQARLTRVGLDHARH